MIPTLVPSLAGLKSTVTFSPGISDVFVQPARRSTPGARPSTCHSTFAPFPSSTITWSQVWGFTQRNSLTSPVIVMTLVTSYATLLWCERAGLAHSSKPASATAVTTDRVIGSLPVSPVR